MSPSSVGRPRSCDCDECPKCKQRIYMKAWWNAKPIEERRAIIARRDKDRARANDKVRYQRDREKRVALAKKWAAANRAKMNEAKYAYRRRHPEKAAARQAVARAVADGRLTRLPCAVCGSEQVQGHHPDYTKPLDVAWLCSRHHAAAHRPHERAA